MIAGERISYNGYEVCLFPLDYLYCTQGNGAGTYSHCCNYATDWIGTYEEYPYYAPFSCHLVGTYPDGNGRAYTSNDKVWTPSGLTYVTILFYHDNNPPTQTSFNQGDLIGHTGRFGFALGDHVHLEQSNAQNSSLEASGMICDSGVCYKLSDGMQPYEIYYLSGNETIVQTLSMTFITWDKPIPSKKFKWWMSRKKLERRKYGL